MNIYDSTRRELLCRLFPIQEEIAPYAKQKDPSIPLAFNIHKWVCSFLQDLHEFLLRNANRAGAERIEMLNSALQLHSSAPFLGRSFSIAPIATERSFSLSYQALNNVEKAMQTPFSLKKMGLTTKYKVTTAAGKALDAFNELLSGAIDGPTKRPATCEKIPGCSLYYDVQEDLIQQGKKLGKWIGEKMIVDPEVAEREYKLAEQYQIPREFVDDFLKYRNPVALQLVTLGVPVIGRSLKLLRFPIKPRSMPTELQNQIVLPKINSYRFYQNSMVKYQILGFGEAGKNNLIFSLFKGTKNSYLICVEEIKITGHFWGDVTGTSSCLIGSMNIIQKILKKEGAKRAFIQFYPENQALYSLITKSSRYVKFAGDHLFYHPKVTLTPFQNELRKYPIFELKRIRDLSK